MPKATSILRLVLLLGALFTLGSCVGYDYDYDDYPDTVVTYEPAPIPCPPPPCPVEVYYER